MSTLSNSISLYKRPSDIKSSSTIPLDIFLENIRAGHWQDIVLPIRALPYDSPEQKAEKKKAVSVTISGTFTERYDNKIDKPSGFIGMDIDPDDNPGLDVEKLKSALAGDKFVQSAFTSIRGRGVCALFRINPEKHREAFAGLSEYILKTYGVVVDPTSVNPSRARFVSFDPYAFISTQQAEKFTQYPKEKPPKRIEKVVFTKDDFGDILKQIADRNLNITQDSYHIWLRLCFSVADKFGEGGREYFHVVSRTSPKYKPAITDRQYNACLRSLSGSKERVAHIETFYYYAKQAGANLYSERTKTIAYTAANGRKSGLKPEQVAENLSKFSGIHDALEVVKQVMDDGIELNEDTLLDQLELWMRQEYDMRRNTVTKYIENRGRLMTQEDLNSIFIKAKKLYEKLTFELMDRLINSDFVTNYNPFLDFINANAEHEPAIPSDGSLPDTPLISRLFACIDTPDAEYALYFGRKWLVGLMSSIYGQHSPLMLVLSGERQNTGKTEFFRRLLPQPLKPYYAESKLDAGKDDEILMCQKLLIVDDEMGGKSKREDKRLKDLTSKQVFSLRAPYRRNNEDFDRIAVLGGTTNDNEIISDTANRRIIPVHVDAIDQAAYNSIDKVALFMEVHALYKAGFRHGLTREDIEYLKIHGGEFEVSRSESELIVKYFGDGTQEWTATDIKVYIETKTNQRLSLDTIGKQLKRIGFVQKFKKVGKSTKRVYLCAPYDNGGTTPTEAHSGPETPPPAQPSTPPPAGLQWSLADAQNVLQINTDYVEPQPDTDLPF